MLQPVVRAEEVQALAQALDGDPAGFLVNRRVRCDGLGWECSASASLVNDRAVPMRTHLDRAYFAWEALLGVGDEVDAETGRSRDLDEAVLGLRQADFDS